MAKILVADDSLTIQKVVSITLAHSNFELKEAMDEEAMIRELTLNQYDLLLLDYSLSSNKTCYQLAQEALSAINKRYTIKIMLLVGAFDTVENKELIDNNIDDYIVKPFDSQKFIRKCNDLITASEPLTTNSLENLKADQTNEIFHDPSDSWKISGTQNNIIAESSNEHNEPADPQVIDPLKSEMIGWGMTPSFENGSLESQFHKIFPPELPLEIKENNILDRLNQSSDFLQSSSLVELENSFDSSDDSNDDRHNKTEPSIHFDSDSTTSKPSSIFLNIDDEITPDSLWAVDDVKPKLSDDAIDIIESKISTTPISTAPADRTITDIHFNSAEIKEQSTSTPQVIATGFEFTPEIEDKLVDKISSAIKIKMMDHLEQMEIDLANKLEKILEKRLIGSLPAIVDQEIDDKINSQVKSYCQKTAERVAWDIIPELAENLIRQEIKEITNSLD